MSAYLLPVLLAVSLSLQAGEPDRLRQALQANLPGVTIDAIRESEIPGLYEITIGPRLYYVSRDGRYLIQGHLIDLSSHTDLTEARLSKVRIAALDNIGEDAMIVFSPDKPKHTVSVFTDIDCGYCRRLHAQIDAYLNRGIKVRYLFFPRAGRGSNSYAKAVAVWCAKDRNAALTAAKQGKPVDMRSCDHPVDQHMALAEKFGVSGTPMIVTDQGEILPGYVPPEQLASHLDQK